MLAPIDRRHKGRRIGTPAAVAAAARSTGNVQSPFAAASERDIEPCARATSARGVMNLVACLPRGLAAKVAPLLPGRSASASGAEDGALTHDACWLDLPSHLLCEIFELLRADAQPKLGARRDMFAAAGVCRQWRITAFEQFFLTPPRSLQDVVHPLQLLSLSGRAMPDNLLRCFVKREATPRHGFGVAHFSLYLGGEEQLQHPNSCKFLLSARQTSRREMVIYLDRKCEGRPIARLQCGLLQMQYRVEAADSCMLPFVHMLTRPEGYRSSRYGLSCLGTSLGPEDREVQTAKLPPVMCEVQYHMRLKGFMRPRKMQVTLPHPVEMACFDMKPAAAAARLQPLLTTCPLPLAESVPSPVSRSFRSLKLGTSGSASRLGASLVTRLRHSGLVMAAAHSAPTSALDAAADAAINAAGVPARSSDDGAAPLPQPQRLPLGLRNKQPHWNDNLRCHCLNFHGRVKEASVKNFQLVCTDAALAAALAAVAEPPPGTACMSPARAARSVALQFGKVEADLYIMDYNPTVVTGLQAFCIALTNFDSRLVL